MDLAILIPIAAVVVGVPGVVAFTALISGHLRKMKELEIRDKEIAAGTDGAAGPAIEALRAELADTRADVAEMQERLDFTERLLSSREPAKRIGEADRAE